jgi:hypothetical protein
MDTGTNGASIQSCDVVASLLFRIATAVFEGMRRCQAEPESRQTGWGVWLSVRKLAGNVAQERTFPPSGLTLKEFATLLEAAHLYAATGACRYGAQQTNGRARHHGLCECPTAALCRTVIALIFTPGSAELLNSVVNEGGRGQSPEKCAELQVNLPVGSSTGKDADSSSSCSTGKDADVGRRPTAEMAVPDLANQSDRAAAEMEVLQ